jgi:hypothetical protein
MSRSTCLLSTARRSRAACPTHPARHIYNARRSAHPTRENRSTERNRRSFPEIRALGGLERFARLDTPASRGRETSTRPACGDVTQAIECEHSVRVRKENTGPESWPHTTRPTRGALGLTIPRQPGLESATSWVRSRTSRLGRIQAAVGCAACNGPIVWLPEESILMREPAGRKTAEDDDIYTFSIDRNAELIIEAHLPVSARGFHALSSSRGAPLRTSTNGSRNGTAVPAAPLPALPRWLSLALGQPDPPRQCWVHS